MPDTTLTYVNDAYCRYFGKPSEQLLGHSFLDLVPAAARSALQAHIEQVQASLSASRPAVSYEHTVHDASGELRWQEWTDRGVFDGRGRLVELQSVGRDITQRKRAELALAESRRSFATLVSNLPGMVYRCRHDADWTLEFASDGCLPLTGYTAEDFLGNHKVSFPDIIHPDDFEKVAAAIEMATRERTPFELVYRITTADGEQKWVWEQGRGVWGTDGELLALEGFITDISESKLAEEALFAEKERAEVTLSSIGDAVVTTDSHGRLDYLNPAAEQLTGWTLAEARGQPCSEVCRIVSEEAAIGNDYNHALAAGRDSQGMACSVVLVNRYAVEYAVEKTATPIRDRDGAILGQVVVLRDVTEARRLQRQILHQATHDALTNLINRYEFERRVEQLIEADEQGSQHALCYLDIDQFKVVNDTCGHAAGDELLRRLARTLRARVRTRDTLCRLGGDEFGLLLVDCNLDNARRICEKLLEGIQSLRFIWEEKQFSVGASIGVVSISGSGEDKAALMSAADAACYAAKDSGRNRVHVHEPGDTELAKRQGEMRWVSRIQEALQEARLALYHQRILPIGDDNAASGEHYELLIRMRDRDDNWVPPGAFLPAAERYNLMPQIDRWVVRTALNWLRDNPDHLQCLQHCAINLSGHSISDQRFLDYLGAQLQETGVPARKICFEITETAVVASLDQALTFISTFQEMGCTFALDDFGSGMSSFAYLKHLPVDFLKIEGAFVRDMVEDHINYAMVKSINDIGHAMGKRTIAEFVENNAILAKLKTLGVDYAQGYGIAKPQRLI